MDGFVRPERYGSSGAHRLLGAQAAKMHFDPLVAFVVKGVVFKPTEIEVCRQNPIEMRQHIAIETGGHSGTVVVSRVEHGAVFVTVHTNQQSTVGAHHLADGPQRAERESP